MISSKLKCGIYASGNNKESVNFQIEFCNNFIRKIGMEAEDVYIDFRNRKRPGMFALKDSVKIGKINCIVYYDESRLARSFTDLFKDILIPIKSLNPKIRFINALNGEELGV